MFIASTRWWASVCVKMAALCTGNYGLTQNCIDTSKEYFFVKLTDSALRAVEEYQKNQVSDKPKVRDMPPNENLGNSRILSMTRVGSNNMPTYAILGSSLLISLATDYLTRVLTGTLWVGRNWIPSSFLVSEVIASLISSQIDWCKIRIS